VRALVELHMGNITPSASSAALFLEGLDPTWVGVIHDAGNMVYEGYENYRLGLEVLGPYLAHVHIKSAAWQSTQRVDGTNEWRAGFAPLRHGIVDLRALFAALHAVGYDRWLSFEDVTPGGDLRARIRDNLSFVKQLWEAAG
jgi:sugar phosphate isomerase/epimerase